ncbi:hypothetical protein ACJJTC_001730, partial [Scirpophaga incertulas]
AVKKRNRHPFHRCGFSGLYEIVCCPHTTDKFGVISKGDVAKKECTKIIESRLVPLDLHIIGGEAASLGEFPHMVALGFDQGDGYSFDCGGALISTTFVVTAAHCVVNLARIQPRSQNLLCILDYVRSTKYHDLALLRLEKPVITSSILNAACLYTRDSDPNVSLIITGWGRTNVTKSLKSNNLLKTTVSPMARDDCNPFYSGWRKLPSGITQGQLCAGDPQGGHDACQGDSGGPLQVMFENASHYELVGVTSFGEGCGTTKPGVYTRIAHYIDWIERIVWPSQT